MHEEKGRKRGRRRKLREGCGGGGGGGGEEEEKDQKELKKWGREETQNGRKPGEGEQGH